MSDTAEIKRDVREFYDSIGWSHVSDGLYQNARYEDLRPVSREYILRSHERVNRYLPNVGKYFLDLGSGPIQYPAYLSYSEGFNFRVCLDLSLTALKEARQRILQHGLYVVGDAAALPFREESFEGLVSLHTIHHLPPDDQLHAFAEIYRVLSPGTQAVIVNSWGRYSPLVRLSKPFIFVAFALIRLYRKIRRLEHSGLEDPLRGDASAASKSQTGSYIHRFSYRWLRRHIGDYPGFAIKTWRSLSTAFLRAFVHSRLGGEAFLRATYRMEEFAPSFFGRFGQYPIILFEKPIHLA